MLHRGLIDVPNHRSSHLIPTPRGGGLACLTGMLVAATSAQILGLSIPWIAIATQLAAVGRPMIALTCHQLFLGAQLRCRRRSGSGRLGDIGLPFSGSSLSLPSSTLLISWTGNQRDYGFDKSSWSAAALWSGLSHDVPSLAVIGAITLGSAAGFLPWNIPIARLLGATSGVTCSALSLPAGSLLAPSHGISPLLLLAPLALYFADTGSPRAPLHFKDELALSPRPHLLSGSPTGMATPTPLLDAWFRVSDGWCRLDNLAVVDGPVCNLLFVGAYLAAPHLMPIRSSPTLLAYRTTADLRQH